MAVVYETDELFQIGMPAWCLSSVFALWTAYGRPCRIVIHPAKTDGWAVVELRDTRLAASIVDTVKESMLHKEIQPVKTIRI